ncbi:PREDICTED: sufE-like protein 2, chloroplastic [Tarenaya hassleriana]|uniref:sufE-like protein 2, chloroplastic n=1 Tax=Tarenaya hassleriana TaxID=28532 RepID=UPI00053C1851|nr:PREDICTED: sufE-like protein 2, chloroplastic [Tarenaya hassleriana]
MTSPSMKSLGSLPPSIVPPRTRPTREASFHPRNPRFSLKSPRFTSLNFGSNPVSRMREFSVNSSPATVMETETPVSPAVVSTADKLRLLASEFRSLSEPIERVKRLLLYAAALSPLDESARIPANRVTGCTTQVWLDVEIDELGKMRFRADSDSEISKGFCSCLIWILDGATAEEVIAVRSDDLSEMNVGVHGKAQSRVNTWHNVLIAMQKRTLAAARLRSFRHPLAPLLVSAGGAFVKGDVSDYSTLPLYYDYTI